MHTMPPTKKSRATAAPVWTRIGLAYEWFLELPVAVVLLVMWVAGTVLLGTSAVLVYAGISALVGMVTGVSEQALALPSIHLTS